MDAASHRPLRIMGLAYLIGHRGASGYEPENTLRSFKAALRDGCNAIELDLRRCGDGHLVIMHDETVERTTNGTGRVADMTLGELKALDAGEGERVPTLQDVINTVRGRCTMFLEMKEEGYEREVLDVLARNSVLEDVFAFGLASRLMELNPILKAHGESLQLLEEVTAETVSKLHGEGRIVVIGTIDVEEEMVHLMEIGVDGIITNWPRILARAAKSFRNQSRQDATSSPRL